MQSSTAPASDGEVGNIEYNVSVPMEFCGRRDLLMSSDASMFPMTDRSAVKGARPFPAHR